MKATEVRIQYLGQFYWQCERGQKLKSIKWFKDRLYTQINTMPSGRIYQI